MGAEAVAALGAADGIEVVAQIGRGDSLDAVLQAGTEVVLDFTSPDIVMDNLYWCIHHGIHAVVGTSGFDAERIARVRGWLSGNSSVGILVVPNFSIGAVLMMRFSQLAAPFFESTEVIEFHHPDKVDAPSGTAIRTAEIIAAARTAAGAGPVPDATKADPEGARGASVAGIAVHAVRARGLVASQEVLFGGKGETLTIRHDSIHRESFMPGVVAAVRAVPGMRGVSVGLDAVLGLD
jgi:4-hydroxy-tetrahydrodipicolinate reductase